MLRHLTLLDARCTGYPPQQSIACKNVFHRVPPTHQQSHREAVRSKSLSWIMALNAYDVKSMSKCMKKAAKWLSLAAFKRGLGGSGIN